MGRGGLEAKLCSEIGKSIKETISAFANEPGLGGGTLLLGVQREESADGKVRYLVRGVPNPDKMQLDLTSACNQVFNVPIRPYIEPAVIEGHVVLTVQIPEANKTEKPIYMKGLGLPKGAFRRIGSSDIVCNDEDISMLFDGRGHEMFDVSIVHGSTMEDIDLEVLQEYRKIRRGHGEDPEVLDWNDIDLLDALGCIKKSQGEITPTVAGLIVFGTKKALRKWFPMMRVDYMRVHGKEWIEDPENRFESIELREPLFRLITKTQGIILENLPKSFSLKDAEVQRTESPTIPLAVIREAVVNSLIHRSYRDPFPVQVIHYSNRLEIRNPGYSVKSVDRLGEPGSMPRNPHIAQILFETRFAENKGSGIKVMQRLMAGAGLAPPAFFSDREDNFFLSTFWVHHFLNENTIEWLSYFKHFGLCQDEVQAIVYARESGTIDNASFRAMASLDTLTASNKLRHLRDLGLLAPQAKGAATYYTPTPFLLDPTPKVALPKSGQIGIEVPLFDAADLRGIDTKYPESTQINSTDTYKSPEPPLKSPVLSKESPELVSSWQYQGLGLTLEASQEAQRLIEKYRPGKYGAKPVVTQFIYELCLVQPLTSDQIATLLRRAKEYVLKDYLTPMIEKGRLEYTIGSSPTHPRQAYRSVVKRKDEPPLA